MNNNQYIFELISYDLVEMDPSQPRQDYGTDGDQNRLYISIKQSGMHQPLTVRKTLQGKYRILDGHRRYLCIKKLLKEDKLKGFEKIPCRVYPELPVEQEERIRFDVQNNRRAWKPIERAQVINRIRESGKFKSQEEVADFLNIPRTLVGNSLQIRSLHLNLITKLQQKDLKTSYQVELARLIPKLCKIKNIEAETIIQDVIKRIDQKAIRSAKELRALRRIFHYAMANEDLLYEYFSDPAMTIDQLVQESNIVRSTLTFAARKTIHVFKEKITKQSKFLSEEKEALKELFALLKKELQPDFAKPDRQIFFVVTSGNKKTDEHYQHTIQTKRSLEEIKSFLSPQEAQDLEAHFHKKSFMIWGHIPANKNISAWETMNPGDDLLIYRKKGVVMVAEVAFKVRNNALAEYLWAKNDQGETYEYLYFFYNESMVDVPQSQINHVFGYSQNYMPQGLVKINQTAVDKVFTKSTDIVSLLMSSNVKGQQ